MKRKRRSAISQPKRSSPAADACIDPGYYSDKNKNDDVSNAIKEANTIVRGQSVDLDKPVMNGGTAGSAAANLARAISSSRTFTTSDGIPLQRENIGLKEPKSSRSTFAYNKQELDAATSVIKTIMKMDAATPFNAPVDPIAMGIPDYFEIIDTPMDFGTICSNLEKGLQYRDAEEVLEDVQLIWDNCCHYNKKGSYILELMKQVRNSFMKQWAVAGLYKDQQISRGRHPHNPQPFAESTMGLEEDIPYPMGSATKGSAYLQHHNSAYLNQSRYQQNSPCCSRTFKPQPTAYQHSFSSHPGVHQHDFVAQHSHYNHLHSVDPMTSNHWLNNENPSLAQSRQSSPSYSVRVHPHQRTFQHQSSSSQINPFHAGINAPRTGGHFHGPHREPTLTFNEHQHAYDLRRNAGDENHTQHYPRGSVPPETYRSSPTFEPVDQLHKSTVDHGPLISHAEGVRKLSFAGNLPLLLPPTESTVKSIEHATGFPQPPLTDINSCHQHDQMTSTPEQSSSMNNNEESEGLENSCESQPASSPSGHLHGDDNMSKKRTQTQECQQSQEESPMVNKQESQPLEDICQMQSGSPQSRPSPPNAACNTKSQKKSRGRGPARCMFLGAERISVTINDQGLPIGLGAQKLASFLGTLARNGNLLPLTYVDWRSVPIEYKENLWNKVQLNFDIDLRSKEWVLQSVSRKWSCWKCLLKTRHYYPHETDEERLADRDERVLPEQWAALIALWSSEAAQKRSERNRANRAKIKFNHASGRKSFAQIREEQRAKMPEGKELSRAELFILTRTRKNGEPVNEEALEVITKLRERAKDQDTPLESNMQDDILSEIIGPNKIGVSRELGTSAVELQRYSGELAIKMVTEANTKIDEMKEKMAAMEQTCTQMASQMAAMMSMMSSMHRTPPDNSVPDVVAVNSGASSDQSLPHEVNTTPCSAGSTRKLRGRKRKM